MGERLTSRDGKVLEFTWSWWAWSRGRGHVVDDDDGSGNAGDQTFSSYCARQVPVTEYTGPSRPLGYPRMNMHFRLLSWPTKNIGHSKLGDGPVSTF